MEDQKSVRPGFGRNGKYSRTVTTVFGGEDNPVVVLLKNVRREKPKSDRGPRVPGFVFKPARGDVPAHWYGQLHPQGPDRDNYVNVHLRDGLEPPQGMETNLHALVEIRKRTTEVEGVYYYSVNLYPAPKGATPAFALSVVGRVGSPPQGLAFEAVEGVWIHLTPVE